MIKSNKILGVNFVLKSEVFLTKYGLELYLCLLEAHSSNTYVMHYLTWIGVKDFEVFETRIIYVIMNFKGSLVISEFTGFKIWNSWGWVKEVEENFYEVSIDGV